MSTVDEANVSVPAMFLRRHAPFVGVFGCLFTFLKSNSEAPPPPPPNVCLLLFENLLCMFEFRCECTCVCVCVRHQPEGMFVRRGVLIHCRVLWCEGTGERREEGSRQDALPALAHQQDHIPTQTYTHRGGGKQLEQKLFNIFCYSCTRKKTKKTCRSAEYSLEQDTQSRNCLKVSVFQRCQSGMS